MWISDGLRGVAWPVSVADTQASWQWLETLDFPWETELNILALSAYAYLRGVSLLLAKSLSVQF